MSLTLEALLVALSFVFGAGVSWGLMKAASRQNRRDLNGLGRKVNSQGERLRDLGTYLLLTAPDDEKREVIRELLKNSAARPQC